MHDAGGGWIFLEPGSDTFSSMELYTVLRSPVKVGYLQHCLWMMDMGLEEKVC
jgi:hypothetical protein